MKPTASIIQRNIALSSRLRNRAFSTALMAALAPAAVPLSQAAQLTWSGGGDNANWSTGANWAGTAPVSNDALIFAGNTNLITNNDITDLALINGTSPAATIAFTNASNVTGGAFTLGGIAITLGGSITTTAMTTGTLVDLISLQLNLTAARPVTTATNHSLTISGLVNDNSGTNSGGITKSGVATLSLSNNSNNFTTLTIQQGTVSATSIEPSGIVSAIGMGNTITMGNNTVEGILTFTGTVAPTGNINRAIALANSNVGARINNNSTAVPLVFNGTFSAAGATNRVMTLGGTNTGANDFQNTMVNPTGGVLSVTKADAGTWTLSGASTYTGQTNINSGTLNAATIADSGSSNLGLGTLIRIGNTSTTGILNYTGTGNTTSRTITIGNNSGTPATGDTGGATINSSGSGALVFTAANFNTTGLTGSLATSRTLTLGGANTGANEIQGVIANGLTGTMATNLAKSGDGTWMLSGANAYTGTTTVTAGTLKLGASNVLPNTAVTIGASGAATTSTLDLNGFSETIGSLTLGRTTTTVAGAIANVVKNGSGSPVLTLGGALTYSAGSVGFLNGQATISANIDTGGAGRSIAVGDGGAEVDLVISGAISGAGNLTKTGTGVLQLSGANTNAGNLVIQDSTVKLGASNVLTDATSINVGNTASIASTTFDLNGFSDTVTSVTLGTTTPGTAGLTNSIVNTGVTGVLTLGGTLTYNAGGSNLNGQATISADVATNTGTRSFAVGDGSATDDLVITGALQAGGGFNVNGGGTLRLDNAGNNHTTSQVSGGSTLKLGANSVLGTGAVNLAQAVAGTSTLDLNGKTDAVGGGLSLSAAATTALGAINQIIDSAGGGVLQLNGAVTYNAGAVGFNNGTTTISASLDLNGALRNFIINDSDQVAQDVIISGVIQNSSGTAGLTKNNAGTLVLLGANTYNGNTNVTAGTLSLSQASLANGADVVITTGAILDLGYAGTDTIDQLFIDGTEQYQGTWGGLNSEAKYKTALITGSGTLTVISGPVEVATDTTAPFITRNGNAAISISVGDIYIDAGAAATDNVDSSVTVNTSGTVNTAVPGTYTLTYSATDAAGNQATPVTRTVTVSDTTAPVITRNGNATVTVSAGGGYTDAGATATDNVDSSVTVNTSGTVNTAVPGTYTLTYSATDAAGNQATPVTRTVTVSDTTAPVITRNGNATVTVSAGGSYTDAGATATDNVDSSVTVTTIGSVNTAVAGTYTLTYSATDAAGNQATQVTRTVTVTAPTFSDWASGYSLTGANATADADQDKDGIKNGVEYVLGGNPTVSDAAAIAPTGVKSGSNYIYTFKRTDVSEANTTVSVDYGNNLSGWTSYSIGAATVSPVVITENDTAADTVVVTIPNAGAAKFFARLKVVVP